MLGVRRAGRANTDDDPGGHKKRYFHGSRVQSRWTALVGLLLLALLVVEFANLLAASVEHPIAYIHMPVPVDRSDNGYFEPLRELALSPGTELFLGLVRVDGVQATRKRIETAAQYVSDFGIATECGMARCRTPELVRTLLMIHAEASAEPHSEAHLVQSKSQGN